MDKRVAKVRKLLDENKLEGIYIKEQANFSWLTGARGFIGLASEAACAGVLITRNDVFLISNNIEGNRLINEEIQYDIKLIEFPWFDDKAEQKILKDKCGDIYSTDTRLSEQFFEMRTVLDEEQIETYRMIAPKIAGILENSMLSLDKGIREIELAGILSEKLWSIGVEPVTILIGFDERMYKRRHPLPTGNRLEKLALGALAVRCKGLYVSATRQICLGKIPKEIYDRSDAVTQVDAALIEETAEGKTMDYMFSVLKKAYSDAGYKNEWEMHHQGGLSGFKSREVKASPKNMMTIKNNQVYAWNPTIIGTKSEDTILLADGKKDILTETGKWEYKVKNGIKRPAILER